LPEPALDDVDRVLAAAALSSGGLRSVLAFDAEPTEFADLAERLALMLALTSPSVGVFRIHSEISETDLWSQMVLSPGHDGLLFQRRPGVITSTAPAVTLVVIPDLARAGLPVLRAVTVVAGSDVAHIERDGMKITWAPSLCWLAACPRDKVGRLSPHALDRFALRITSRRRAGARTREADLRAALIPSEEKGSAAMALEPAVAQTIEEASRRRPAWRDGALNAVLDYFPEGLVNPRREATLARLAHELARLGGDAEVESRHVQDAAGLMGFASSRPSTAGSVSFKPDDAAGTDGGVTPGSGEDRSQPDDRKDGARAGASSGSWVYDPGPPVSVEAYELEEFLADPVYPEDRAPSERDPASLRLPATRQSPHASLRGPVIGVEPARTLRDLAVVETLFESAKYQFVRRRTHPGSGGRLLVSPTDLRSYRRAAAPQQMLIVVLDHTVQRGWDWTTDLMPFFSWAYSERATVGLVRVGAADAGHELRAERSMVRNVLDPSLSAALDTGGGRATPLAHGLDLALQTLRHALQHGSATVRAAWLVVATDGRGNVPLQASYEGNVDRSVGSQGVDDSLAVAAEIAALDGVHAAVVAPERDIYPELVFDLAQALGGKVGARAGDEVATGAPG
jgi:magnesium chelatase subunit D